MTKETTRNKFRDSLSDYYRTNKQVEKEFPAKRGGPWLAREKSMLTVAIILAVIIICKYLFF